MGSGETTQSLKTLYKKNLKNLPKGNLTSLYLTVPFEFQENYHELCEKGCKFFYDAFRLNMQCLGFAGNSNDENAKGIFASRLLESDFIFSGPGSPTYALKRFKEFQLGDILAEKIKTSSLWLAFSSAALITLGTFSLPVYEIYKVGHEPYWEQGINFLGTIFGQKIVVVPHFNNKEGGTHDTSCCYVGRRRFNLLLEQLDPSVLVIGIDEHTGLNIDLLSQNCEIYGKGSVSLIRDGKEISLNTSEAISLTELLNFNLPSSNTNSETTIFSLNDSTDLISNKIGQNFDELYLKFLDSKNSRDLEYIASLVTQATELLLGDHHNEFSNELYKIKFKSMILSLAEIALSSTSQALQTNKSLLDLLMSLRDKLRRQKQYELSDYLRLSLNKIGIQVNDTLNGSTWSF